MALQHEAPAAAVTLHFDTFLMEIWAFGMVSPTQSLWSICWAEAAAETEEGRAPACPGLPAGFVPSALGAEQCKSGSPVPVPVSHREGTSSSILRAGVSHHAGEELLSPRSFSALIFPLLMPRNPHTLSKMPQLDSTLGFSRYSGKENHPYLLTESSAATNFGSFFMIPDCRKEKQEM